MLLEISQSQVYLPMKMKYKIAGLPSTRASIDKWFNSAAAKSEVTRGYENQEHSSVLLGQTYLVAGVIRPRVQAPASDPDSTPAAATDGPAAVPDPGTGGDGTEARPLEVLDSDDELFLELDLTPEQEERIRRRFTRIRSETSSSSS